MKSLRKKPLGILSKRNMGWLLWCQTPWPHGVMNPLCSTLQREEPGEWGKWARDKHQRGPSG